MQTHRTMALETILNNEQHMLDKCNKTHEKNI